MLLGTITHFYSSHPIKTCIKKYVYSNDIEHAYEIKGQLHDSGSTHVYKTKIISCWVIAKKVYSYWLMTRLFKLCEFLKLWRIFETVTTSHTAELIAATSIAMQSLDSLTLCSPVDIVCHIMVHHGIFNIQLFTHIFNLKTCSQVSIDC